MAMSPDQYRAGIERVPLRIERDTTDGKGWICRDINGQAVHVDKPDLMSERERELALEHYRSFYGPTQH